jgi:hypothetical protein
MKLETLAELRRSLFIFRFFAVLGASALLREKKAERDRP